MQHHRYLSRMPGNPEVISSSHCERDPLSGRQQKHWASMRAILAQKACTLMKILNLNFWVSLCATSRMSLIPLSQIGKAGVTLTALNMLNLQLAGEIQYRTVGVWA